MFPDLFDDPSAHPGWPIAVEPVRVRGGVVALRPIRRRDAREWSAARLADRDELTRWEPTPEGEWRDRNSRSAWPATFAQQRRSARYGSSIPAVIEYDGTYAGQITIGGIARGSLSSAWIGYWVSRRCAGRGVATAAVALAVDHAFREVGLHRLDATVRPENGASRTVLGRNGFREEGLLRRYLHVDGAWRDHLLVATTREEQGAGAVARLVAEGRVARIRP